MAPKKHARSAKDGDGCPNKEVVVYSENKPLVYSEEELETKEVPSEKYFDFSVLNDGHSKYTVDEKFKAVMAYVTTGSFIRASEISKIPANTISNWKNKASWWRLVSDYCRQMKHEELDGMLTQAIHLAVDIMLRQLKEGQKVWDPKAQELVVVDVPFSKLTAAFAVLWEKRNLQRGEYFKPKDEGDAAVLKQLEMLKSQFEGFAKEQKSKSIALVKSQEGVYEVQ